MKQQFALSPALESEDELYLTVLKSRTVPVNYKNAPQRLNTVGYSNDFFSVVEKYYMPWFDDLDKAQYESFIEGLHCQAVNDCSFFKNLIFNTVPIDVFDGFPTEIQQALKPDTTSNNNAKIGKQDRDRVYKSQVAVSDDEFKNTLLYMKKQTAWLMRLYVIPGMDQEDIRQHIYLGYFKALPHFDPKKNGGHLRRYLQTCAQREMFNLMAVANGRGYSILNNAIPLQEDEILVKPTSIMVNDGIPRLKTLCLVFSKLSSMQASIFKMYLAGETIDDIKKTLEVSDQTVYQSLSYARSIYLGSEVSFPKKKYNYIEHKKKQAEEVKPIKLKKPAEIISATSIGQLKRGSLHETILRVLHKGCAVDDQVKIFASPFCNVLHVSMTYSGLCQAVALDDDYLLGLEKLMLQAEAGRELAKRKISRTHEKRMAEAMYTLAQTKDNRNGIRLKRMGLILKTFKLKGHKFVSLLRKDKEAEFNLQINFW